MIWIIIIASIATLILGLAIGVPVGIKMNQKQESTTKTPAIQTGLEIKSHLYNL
jgi:flagellar basal body-associated protein FliL